MRRACAEAVEELKAARQLIRGQAAAIEQGEKLLAIQTEIETKLRGINALSNEEKADLYRALEAKDRAIASLEKSNRELRKRNGVWGKIKVGVIAVAVGLIAGRLL